MSTRRNFLTAVSGTLAVLPLLSFEHKDANANEILNLPAPDDPLYWQNLRKQFPMPPDETYFNTGTLGAQPLCVVNAVINDMRKKAEQIAQWDFKSEDNSWISGYGTNISIREKLGKLINADVKEIALLQNATMGMNLIANGLNLNPGDEVLSTNQEHPGGKCGWELRSKRQGIVWVPVVIPVPINDPDEIVNRFKSAITSRTRVIAIPHIISATGVIIPLKRICSLAREKGIFTVIDGAQSVGHIKVDVKDIGCDAYFGSPHKWVLAPAGSGFLYVCQEQMKNVWTTLASGQWDNQEDGGFRLQQRGTGNPSLLVGFEAALDFFHAVGADRVIARIKELGDRLRSGLQKNPRVHIYSSVHPEICAGITTYRIEGMTGDQMQGEFWKRRKMRPRSVGKELGVRHSVHIYNSIAEIDGAIEIVNDLTNGN